ncbi:MAG: diacylglycerol kinase family lipid kinase [Bacteroidetes bacterium]|nr:diacylglycerol kinase family lipid kinase [Bacteroidota bacterium]
MGHIAFIIHGKLHGNNQLVSKINSVFSSDYELSFSYTEYCGHGMELAKNSADSNADYIIAVTGDGTFNEVINGVMLSQNKKVKLGLLPHGTGNDFARMLGLSNDIMALKKMIETDSFKKIDVGFVNFKNLKGENDSRYFINITDLGMGGFIAKKLSGSSKWLGATLTFQWAIVSTFLTYKHQVMKIRTDDFLYEGKILSYIIANGKYFGAGLGIAPDAKPDDGFFEIVMASEISLWDYLKNLNKIRACTKVEHPKMNYLRAKEIFIETQDQPIDMDGEFIGYSPMKISIVPHAIQMLCP